MTGEGLPLYHDSGHGDLFVEYNVVLPLTVAPKVKTRKSQNLLDCERAKTDGVPSTDLEAAFNYKTPKVHGEL